MKSVFCKIIKLPEQGSELRICVTHRTRGGRSEASLKIGTSHFWRQLAPGEIFPEREVWNYQPDPNAEPIVHAKRTRDESCAAIIEDLAKQVSLQWSGESFSCRSRGDELVITTNEDDHVFYPMLNGRVEDGDNVIAVEQ